ncbi:MAG: hypothetical protein EP319_04310 [Deltaproteobacteria bacterium]|nr:MAG: hypothetical protein EP319_04310 [Deltaproteobacteria bacterium]
MRITITDWKLRQELDRVFVLHWTHFGLLCLSILTSFIKFETPIYDLVLLGLLITFYRLYYLTIKKLFYTFWTFSIVLILSLVGKIVFAEISQVQFYLYALAVIFIVMEMYILHNPIYYPIVSWWEYDFRYRHDLKVTVSTENHEKIKGRLNDLRRESAGLQLFEDLAIGSKLDVQYGENKFKGEIMSKRRYSVGRPWTYGFKFYLENAEEKHVYEELMLSYKNEKLLKTKDKFKKTTS